VTSRLGTGKSITFFYGASRKAFLVTRFIDHKFVRMWRQEIHIGRCHAFLLPPFLAPIPLSRLVQQEERLREIESKDDRIVDLPAEVAEGIGGVGAK
jgi:hypothetical protein